MKSKVTVILLSISLVITMALYFGHAIGKQKSPMEQTVFTTPSDTMISGHATAVAGND